MPLPKDVLGLLEKKRRELPKIFLYNAPHISQREGYYYCFLETGPDSIGWKIIRADVKQVEPSLSAPILDKHQDCEARKCIKNALPPQQKGEWTEYGPFGEWSDYCEWPEENNLYDIVIHDHCGSALLEFTCEMPTRKWWNRWRKQVKIPFKYEKGADYPEIRKHPAFWNR